MKATHPTRKNSSPRIRQRYYNLGTDTMDTTHVYRTTDETIFAVANGTIEHRFDLDTIDKSADEYMAFVAEQRGWAQRQYGFAAYLDRIAEVI
jgi:ribosomal protein L27